MNSRAQTVAAPPTVGAISGVVRDQQTGAAISGALVEAINKGVARAAFVRAVVGVPIRAELDPGQYTVVVLSTQHSGDRQAETPHCLFVGREPGKTLAADRSVSLSEHLSVYCRGQ
jgi:hypothetical protein